MVKFLGIIDILAAVLLLSFILGIEVPAFLLVIIPVALLLKASIYVFDIGSLTDFGIAILILLSFFWVLPVWLLLIGAVLIAIKGLMSLFA
jgi:hypothetical protein